MKKSIIIIGGGIGGLSAGCFANRNGFSTEIFEKNPTAGGLCTAWKRKEFMIDGCIHWLVGTDPSAEFYKLWDQLGMVKNQEFFYYDYFTQYEDTAGNLFKVFGDPDKWRDHMISFSKEDEKLITSFTRDIKKIMRQDMPIDFDLKSALRAIPTLFLFMKYKMPLRKFAAKFKSPLLRKLFIEALDWHDMPVIFIFWTLALMGAKKAGYPVGGSDALISSALKKYEELGGRIKYNATVTGIIVEHDKAVGIRLSDGTEHRADYIISASDGHRTIYDWLGGRYTNRFINKCYETLIPFPGIIYASFGLNRDYHQIPYGFQFQLQKPVIIGSEEVSSIGVRNHWFDKVLCPEGKAIFNIMIPQDYSFWKSLAGDRERYLAEKHKAQELIITALEEHLPGIREEIIMTDLATPLTFERYTGNWKGSYEGWLMSPKHIMLQLPSVLPGLSNFYMAGHWISPGGGLPSGLLTGRKAIAMICKKEKRSFQ
jgi:phytoene dehydrogenase-like protein